MAVRTPVELEDAFEPVPVVITHPDGSLTNRMGSRITDLTPSQPRTRPTFVDRITDALWNRYIPGGYARLFDNSNVIRKEWQEFADRVPVIESGVYMVAMCGDFRDGQLLAERMPGVRFVGVDKYASVLRTAQRRLVLEAPEVASRVALIQADVTKPIDLPPSFADGASLHHGLQYLHPKIQPQVFQNLAPLLREGAFLDTATFAYGRAFREVVNKLFEVERVEYNNPDARKGITPIMYMPVFFAGLKLLGQVGHPFPEEMRAWHEAAGFSSFEKVTDILWGVGVHTRGKR